MNQELNLLLTNFFIGDKLIVDKLFHRLPMKILSFLSLLPAPCFRRDKLRRDKLRRDKFRRG